MANTSQAENDAEAAEWRRRLRDDPEQWRHGLELRRALLAGYHYPDCDAAFRASTRHMPDDAWFAHYRDLALFHPADLAELRARGERLLAQGAEAAAVHGFLSHVAAQQRDYAAAAAHLSLSDAPDRASRGAALAVYRRMAEWIGRAPGSGPRYAIAVINLDRNPGRMVDLRRSFARSAPDLHRIPGVLGSALPDEEVRRLGGDPGMRGTLGCFLSHVAAWRWMLAEGLSHCLVVEDDVMALVDLPAGLGAFGLPEAFDICFVNDRLQPSLAGRGDLRPFPWAGRCGISRRMPMRRGRTATWSPRQAHAGCWSGSGRTGAATTWTGGCWPTAWRSGTAPRCRGRACCGTAWTSCAGTCPGRTGSTPGCCSRRWSGPWG